RDTPPDSGIGFIRQLEDKMHELGVGEIATISGRYYAMDRDKNWDRVVKAYDAMTKGIGNKAQSAVSAMEKSYANGIVDEFI
ncbi:2,3-bisphosphoglycerate-independent phosphoglycerate mutase, partial [Acinetobacter sp. 163]|nr:2,3-bisphosphoglycerate-independent phosphoglycerate mutase [Acinetobacter sp. 163]